MILVTHHHKDHCKGVTTNRLRGKDTSVIATRDCVKELGEEIAVVEKKSAIKVVALHIGEIYRFR